MSRAQFEVIEGATWSFDVELSDEFGEPYDLSGFTAILPLKSEADGAVIVDVISSECVITPLLGLISVDVPFAKTTSILDDAAPSRTLVGYLTLTNGAVVYKFPVQLIVSPA